MMAMETVTRVDLEGHRSKGARVFAGRVRGQRVREASKLREHDKGDAIVEIVIPRDVISINASFFLGMFGDSIRELKEEGFRRKYRFVGKNVDRVVEDAIAEALREKSPF